MLPDARPPVPPTHAHGQPATTGVLLCNLGTPDAPTPAAVRRYLAEFLSDPRVVEIPRLAWLPLLYGLILPLRSAKSANGVWGATRPCVGSHDHMHKRLSGPRPELIEPGRKTSAPVA